MKIYRGPQTTKIWQVTDTKPAAQWAETRQPGTKVKLDGTIEKFGQRHTDLGVEIETDDVIALSNALLRHQKARIEELEASEKELSDDAERMRSVLRKISRLVGFRNSAPSLEAVFEDIRRIATAARDSDSEEPIDVEWIDWKTL